MSTQLLAKFCMNEKKIYDWLYLANAESALRYFLIAGKRYNDY